MKNSKNISFKNCEEMASFLRTGITLVDENGTCYDYCESMLNPYRYEDSHDEGPIDEQWDLCDGKYQFKVKR